MDILYVCSRPIIEEDGQAHRHLIGILSQRKKKEYSFEYKLNDNINTNQFILPFFPDKHKTYTTNEVRQFLDDFLPSENDTSFIQSILKKDNITEYDEWTWLKLFEPDDNDIEIRLYDTLPDDVIRHDIINKTSDNTEINEDEKTESDNENSQSDIFDIFGNNDIVIIDDEKNEENDTEQESSSENSDFFPDLFDTDFHDDDFKDPETESESEIIEDIILTDEDVKELKTSSFITSKERVVKKRIIKHKVEKNTSSDFIHSPPEDPFEALSKRLEENIKQRQNELAEIINKQKTNS